MEYFQVEFLFSCLPHCLIAFIRHSRTDFVLRGDNLIAAPFPSTDWRPLSLSRR